MDIDELTKVVIGCCFEVSNELGSGFLESVYEKSLAIALREKGLKVDRQAPISVGFRGHAVGDFFADIVVNQALIVELKAVKSITPEHAAQVLNYLRASHIRAGLLVNFGVPRAEIRRFNNYFDCAESDHPIIVKHDKE